MKTLLSVVLFTAIGCGSPAETSPSAPSTQAVEAGTEPVADFDGGQTKSAHDKYFGSSGWDCSDASSCYMCEAGTVCTSYGNVVFYCAPQFGQCK